MVGITTQDLIDKVFWDKRIISIPPQISSPYKEIIIAYPTLEERNHALYLKESLLQECIDQGVPTESDILASAIKTNNWSQEEENFLEKVDIEIESFKAEMAIEKFVARRRKLNKKIEYLIRYKDELSVFRNKLLSHSAEYMAYEAYIHYILPRIILQLDNQYCWNNDLEFIRCKKEFPELIFFLIKEAINNCVMSTAEIRQIARSVDWRILWNSSKENLVGLFNKPIPELNNNQKLVVFWSRVYDSVFEDPNRPTQDIIDDDSALDDWLSNRTIQYEEDKKPKTSIDSVKVSDHTERIQILDGYHSQECRCGVKNIKIKGHGQRPVHDAGCPWGTWIAYTEEEKYAMANQVYARNSPVVRRTLAEQTEKVQKLGLVKEQQLRDQKTRMVLGFNQNKERQ